MFASGAGAASRVSLGMAVFGGMGLATLLGVFYIPVLYAVVQGTADRFSGGGKPEGPPAPAPAPSGD